MTVLSVNLNKIAVLRNSRGEALPSVIDAARACIAAGCGGITLHPRPDQRHIRPHDVDDLCEWLPVELNLEGNPFAGPTARGYPGFMALVEKARPAQCTLVPDSDGQITSDHGFDLASAAGRLRPVIARLKAWGCRVSLFMDAGAPGLERAAELGADRIELYTGPYAKAFAAGDAGAALDACARSAEQAAAIGLGVNAGHDLNQANLGAFLRHVPRVLEVSIGHALIGEALYDGLVPTVRSYLRVIAGAVILPDRGR
jgi:pyridoxine 5-phosphate synthase